MIETLLMKLKIKDLQQCFSSVLQHSKPLKTELKITLYLK